MRPCGCLPSYIFLGQNCVKFYEVTKRPRLIQASWIGSLESIPGLLKSLQIRAQATLASGIGSLESIPRLCNMKNKDKDDFFGIKMNIFVPQLSKGRRMFRTYGVNIFYRPPLSPLRYRERWNGRKETLDWWQEWCHQLYSPRLVAPSWPAQAEERSQGPPPPSPFPPISFGTDFL
jgi:hypothetical protein